MKVLQKVDTTYILRHSVESLVVNLQVLLIVFHALSLQINIKVWMKYQLYYDVHELLLTSSANNDTQYDDNDEKNDNHSCCCSTDDVEHQVAIWSRRNSCWNYTHMTQYRTLQHWTYTTSWTLANFNTDNTIKIYQDLLWASITAIDWCSLSAYLQ